MKFHGETVSFEPRRIHDSQLLTLLGLSTEQEASLELPFEHVHALACSALAKSRAGYQMDERDVVAWELRALYRIPENERDDTHWRVITAKESRLAELHTVLATTRDRNASSAAYQARITSAEALMETLNEFNTQRLKAAVGDEQGLMLFPGLDADIADLLDQEAASFAQ